MITLHSLNEAEEYLLQYSPEKDSGETYTLERIQALMDRLGNPENKLHIIHVAGTSGKTSTAYFIRALLEATGAKTGLTASPHIVSIAERVQIAGRPLPEGMFLKYLNDFLSVINEWPELEPTYFELLVAFAFWVFVREKVDYAVIEVGLGGLLDGTNVINRRDKVCVIAPIGFDHMQVLGNTLAAIAAQKAGIITAENDVFVGPQEPEAMEVLVAKAKLHDANLHQLPAVTNPFKLPWYQAANFALASEVTRFILKRDHGAPLTHQMQLVASQQSPPGRFEHFFIDGKTIILDGAHNPQKLTALRITLSEAGVENMSWLLGFIDAPDQKIDNCIKALTPTINEDTVVTQFAVGQDFKSRKSVGAGQLQEKLLAVGCNAAVIVDPRAALDELLKRKPATIVVTGSLYLVAVLRPYIITLSR
jgi:dihydrofolate synthase/folylpolyglutamate synthase